MQHDPGEDSRTMSLWSLPISCHCPQDFHRSLTGCASCGWLIVTLKWKTFFNLWCPKVRILSSQFQILATSSYSKLCLFKLIALINYFRHEEDCVSQCSRYHSIWQGITGGKLGTIFAFHHLMLQMSFQLAVTSLKICWDFKPDSELGELTLILKNLPYSVCL